MSESEASLMSDVFRPYEKLVEITIMGKTFSRSRAKLAAARVSIHQPGNDPVRALLLESGLSVLPRELPAFGRRHSPPDS